MLYKRRKALDNFKAHTTLQLLLAVILRHKKTKKKTTTAKQSMTADSPKENKQTKHNQTQTQHSSKQWLGDYPGRSRQRDGPAIFFPSGKKLARYVHNAFAHRVVEQRALQVRLILDGRNHGFQQNLHRLAG
jgi:hypothetical protein